MNKFCEDCVDRGSEQCPLRTPEQKIQDIVFTSVEVPLGVLAMVGEAAMSSGPMRNHRFVVDPLRSLRDKSQSVRDCIEHHQNGNDISVTI